MSAPSVIITGTSSGLGLDAAIHLAAHGFRVYAAMRDITRRQALDQAANLAGVSLTVLPMDVTRPAQVAAAVDETLRQSGRIDALVNNAGTQLRGCLEDSSDAEIRQVFEVNLFGAMAVTRAVLPIMRQAGRGRILFVSSIGGRIGSPGLSAYCASKFAVEGFCEALALETRALGIHVSSVAPAIIRTPIWQENRRVAAGAASPDSPYAADFRQGEILADRMVARSRLTPRHVSRTILRALTESHPRVHYVVGRKASAMLIMRRWLPGESFERLYRHTLDHLVRGNARPSARDRRSAS